MGGSPVTSQVGYRWRRDDGTETSATWIALENDPATLPLDTPLRLRFSIHNNGSGDKTFLGLQLEYSLNGGAYNSVTGASSVVRASSSSNVDDGELTTRQLNLYTPNPSGGNFSTKTFQASEISTDGSAAAGSPLSSGQQREVEYVIQLRSADLASGDVVTLRVTDSGVALNNYAVYARALVLATRAALTSSRSPR